MMERIESGKEERERGERRERRGELGLGERLFGLEQEERERRELKALNNRGFFRWQ